jgi:hypothetical protein
MVARSGLKSVWVDFAAITRRLAPKTVNVRNTGPRVGWGDVLTARVPDEVGVGE